MTDLTASADPALGLLEMDSVAIGILTGDAMAKASPVAGVHTGTVHPGRYIIAVSGDTASVEVALEAGRTIASAVLVAEVFLPAVDPAVTAAVVSGSHAAHVDGDAVGIVECTGVAAAVDAADAGVKAASVRIAALQLADGLGGRGYVIFTGDLAEVEAAVEAATDRAGGGSVLHSVVVAQLAEEMRGDLRSELRFNRVVSGAGGDD